MSFDFLQPVVKKILALDYSSSNLSANENLKRLMQDFCQQQPPIPKTLFDCPPDQEIAHVLHQAKNNGLMISLIRWGHEVKEVVHNHLTWAVVGVLAGTEQHTAWHRLDNQQQPGHAHLKKHKTFLLQPGDVITMKKHDIHSVCNQTQNNGTAISLHVYGQDLRTTGRSKFDTVNMTESPYEMTFVPFV